MFDETLLANGMSFFRTNYNLDVCRYIWRTYPIRRIQSFLRHKSQESDFGRIFGGSHLLCSFHPFPSSPKRMTRFPKVTSFILAIFVLVSSSCLNDSTKHGVDAAAFSPNSVKGRKHPSHQGKNHRSFAAPHLVAQSSQFYPRGHYDPIAFRKPSSLLANSADDNKEDDARVSSNKAELILEQIHSKSFRYRIVVSNTLITFWVFGFFSFLRNNGLLNTDRILISIIAHVF